MKTEIITIGDEILNGQIIDSNSAWIAQQLMPLNYTIVQISSISDQAQAIQDALDQAQSRADIILVTGGLGPTNDDVTKQTIASYFKTRLRRDDAVLAHVKGLFARLGYAEMPPINNAQADVLELGEVLFNDVGTAPGMWVSQGEKVFVFMPGVPFEMKFLMQKRVLPKLRERHAEHCVYNAHLLTIGLGESHLAQQIADIESRLPQHIHLAYLPKMGLVRLRLTAQGLAGEEALLAAQTQSYVDAIVARLGTAVVAQEDISLEQALLRRFTQDAVTLSTAESCTGGMISASITALSGASAVFKGAVVAYDNAVKERLLAVPADSLQQHGAVSEQVVRQMALGVQQLLQTDYTVATSGIAGPTGGSEAKPVGTVWIAVAGPGTLVSKVFHFKNDRQINIERSTAKALQMLWSIYQQENRI